MWSHYFHSASSDISSSSHSLCLAISESKWKGLFELILEEGPRVAFVLCWEERHARNRLGYVTASRNENRFHDTIVVGQWCAWSSHNSGVVSLEKEVHYSLLWNSLAQGTNISPLFHPGKLPAESSLCSLRYLWVSAYSGLCFTSLLFLTVLSLHVF